MYSLASFALTVAICSILAYLAWRWRVFDGKGIAGAFALGVFIGVAGTLLWLLILVVFLAISFVATRHRLHEKRRMKLHEGVAGERSLSNILANGLVPCAVVLLYALRLLDIRTATLLFGAAVATATSDTLASEFGVLEGKAYLITTLKEVPVGTNGGVSWRGEGGSVLGASVIAICVYLTLLFEGYTLLTAIPLIAAMGFLGCQVDSVLGATLESRGLIGKGCVNFLSILLATLLTFILVPHI